MEVKEAIEFIKETFNVYKKDAQNNFIEMDKCNRVISLLQLSEAYRLMWEELDKKYGHYRIEITVRKSRCIDLIMEELERKYFLKENYEQERNT